MCQKNRTSSIHVLYTILTKEYFSKDVFLHRKTHQYHFKNKGYKCFNDFLNGLEKSKRKQIQKEELYSETVGSGY